MCRASTPTAAAPAPAPPATSMSTRPGATRPASASAMEESMLDFAEKVQPNSPPVVPDPRLRRPRRPDRPPAREPALIHGRPRPDPTCRPALIAATAPTDRAAADRHRGRARVAARPPWPARPPRPLRRGPSLARRRLSDPGRARRPWRRDLHPLFADPRPARHPRSRPARPDARRPAPRRSRRRDTAPRLRQARRRPPARERLARLRGPSLAPSCSTAGASACMPQDEAALAEPINALERDRDPDGVWRRAVNDSSPAPTPICSPASTP